MADEKATFTFEQRKDGGEKLLAALTEAGIKAELIAEKGRTENFDSVRVRIFDGKGVAASDLTVNARGYVNVGYVYTDGKQSVTSQAQDIAEELQGSEVSAKFVKTKASPGGTSFLGKLN
jgi:hypothetical protein